MANADKGAYEYLSIYKADYYIHYGNKTTGRDGSTWIKAFGSINEMLGSKDVRGSTIYYHCDSDASSTDSIGSDNIDKLISCRIIYVPIKYPNFCLSFNDSLKGKNLGCYLEGFKISGSDFNNVIFNRCVFSTDEDTTTTVTEYLVHKCSLYNSIITGNYNCNRSSLINSSILYNCKLDIKSISNFEYLYDGGASRCEVMNTSTILPGSFQMSKLCNRTFGLHNDKAVLNNNISTYQHPSDEYLKDRYDINGYPRLIKGQQ